MSPAHLRRSSATRHQSFGHEREGPTGLQFEIFIDDADPKRCVATLILSNAVRLGTTGLAKTLSKEFGGLGITVNNVAPGLTMTDRIRPVIEAQAKASGRTFEDVAAEREARIPLRRMAQPEDVAAMIVFLASKQARQITGQTLVVDGGATAAVM